MLVDETLANVKKALAHFAQSDPRLAAHLAGAPLPPDPEPVAVAEGQVKPLPQAFVPPVIGSPLWFLEEVCRAYGQERTDYLVDELCGLKVIQREELSEPLLVMPDGKYYTIVPEWARKTAEQLQVEEMQRLEKAGIIELPQPFVPEN